MKDFEFLNRTDFYKIPTINKTTGSKYWQRCGERGTLIHLWRECKLAQTIWKSMQKTLQKLKISRMSDSALLLLGICSKSLYTVLKYAWPCSLLHYSIDNETVVHAHMEYYLTIKKNYDIYR